MKKCGMKKGGKVEHHEAHGHKKHKVHEGKEHPKSSMKHHEAMEMKEEKRHHSQMKKMHEKMPKGYAMGGAAKVRKGMPHCGKKGK